MQRLGFYLFRQLATAFIFSAVAVSFVVLFTQSFRMLSLVIDNSSTLWVFFQLMALSVPTFLPLVLPLGLGVATIFVYNKLAIDSELVVMRAAGISPMRQAMPALAMAGMVVLVCFALTLWLTPAANRGLVTLQYKIRDNFAVFLSRPGNFNDITEGLTFYAHKRGSNGALEGILIHDVRKPETPVTIMANTGQVVENAGQPQIVVFNGRRQELDTVSGHLSELAFDQYVLDLNALRSGTEGHRLPEAREQSTWELLNPTPEMLTVRTSREHLMTEFNQRFATPLMALAFTFIGLTAILAGEFNRRGMGKRILIASLAIITVQASYMSLTGIVTKNSWLAFLLYLVPLSVVPICLIFINIEYFKPRMAPASAAPKVITT
ncbi:MAG TPA: LptF/LptG family permease [Alphaproteobacteria bacterium]|nr:LptF/LptG family permease [Alphaproteobacteria bacterium]